jgi:hypothetical protein
MPVVYFAASSGAAFSIASTTQTKLIKHLGTSSHIDGKSTASIVGISRVRSFPTAKTIATFEAETTLRLRHNLKPGPIGASSRAMVTGFVNRNNTAIPKGKLLVTDVDPLLNPMIAHPPLNGRSIARGDLIPVHIVVEGQKLGDLSGLLEVKGVDITTQAVYTFASSATFAAPTLETQLVERRSGSILIEPNQTLGFPIDRNITCQYKFVLSDGNGRVYTIEVGNFTVFPVLL